MRQIVAALLFGIGLLAAAPAGAAMRDNQVGGFTVLVPDGWVVEDHGPRLIAHNPADTIQLVVGPLADADADLNEVDVLDFVDDELDDMHVTTDRMGQQASKPARFVEGTGTDEGDDVAFRAVAIDPAANRAVIVALVYGESDVAARGQAQAVISRILESFRPR